MLTRYIPFTALETAFAPQFRLGSFQDTLSKWLDETTTGRPWTPPVDILEMENALILKADLPDVDMKDIHVELENGTLTLRGQRKFESEKKEKGDHRIERSYGSFTRYFSMPDTVDAEKISAEYKNGVLTVTLPKKEIAKPRTVKIELKN
ncbi:MAG: Hsp20/alpha crystallin family protein [Acidobacteria bacterium]|nr:Hsp20/alpha crystallin family protein [Acidobacteriota bacterium]